VILFKLSGVRTNFIEPEKKRHASRVLRICANYSEGTLILFNSKAVVFENRLGGRWRINEYDKYCPKGPNSCVSSFETIQKSPSIRRPTFFPYYNDVYNALAAY